jgi:putative membrane protein
MVGFIVSALISALAVVVTAAVLPQIAYEGKTEVLLGVAVAFGVINGLVRPLAKALSLPLKLLTLGTYSFIVNAVLLLLVAWVSEQAGYTFTVGGFPPDITAETIGVAIVASLVISVVTTVASLAVRR